MSCYCQPKIVSIIPKDPCPGKCLRLTTIRIGCDDGPECGETLVIDLEEFNDTSKGENVKYTLTETSYEGFDSVTLTEGGILTFVMDDTIIPDLEEEISYRVYEDGGLLSNTGYVLVCSRDECKWRTTDCLEGQECDSCSGDCYDLVDLEISDAIEPDLEITIN